MRISQICNLRGAYLKVLVPTRPQKRAKDPILIGFDTEFHPETHQLLSAQLSLGKDKTQIYYPQQPLTTQTLHGIVLGFLKKHGIEAPSNSTIILLSHYALAEISQIKDYLENLRLHPYNQSLTATFRNLNPKLKIIDLYAYYPTSLEKIGEALGYPKIELDRTKIHYIKQENPSLFEAYAKRDPEITIEAYKHLRNLIWNTYQVDILKTPTMASVSATIFRQKFLKEPSSPYATERFHRYRKKGNSYVEQAEGRKIFAGDLNVRFLALRCYWGGRSEAYARGLITKHMEYYDVASLYPSSAMLQPLPNIDTKWIKFNSLKETEGLEGFCEAHFEFPKETMYPCLPVAEDWHSKLYFPLKGRSFCTLSEVRKALELNAEINHIQGYGFHPNESEINHPLKTFFQHFTIKKQEEVKGSLNYETWKLIMNSLIGKFCQRNLNLVVEDLQKTIWEQDLTPDALGKMLRSPKTRKAFEKPNLVGASWSPEWSTLILGKARSLMSDLINKGAYFTSTDSVLYSKGTCIQCQALKELESVGSGLKKEHEATQALIIRTRFYVLWKKNEIVKTARHGAHTSEETFKNIITQILANPDKAPQEIKVSRNHLVKLGEALRFGKPLGTNEQIERTINFKWDEKRTLMNPAINPFTETKPLTEAPNLFQRKKLEGYREDAQKLKREGLSERQIAKQLGIAKGSVHWLLTMPKNQMMLGCLLPNTVPHA